VKHRIIIVGIAAVLLIGLATQAGIEVAIDHNDNSQASPAFKFKNVPSPSTNDDVAIQARFTIVEGDRDGNSGEVSKLNDGKLPTEQDQPRENFFFSSDTEVGRLLVDLGSVINIKQVNTYSWHPSTRGPQIYRFYASDGPAGNSLQR
jgi:hypothetical protein